MSVYAMQWEPPMPPRGTPEREKMERKHAEATKGLAAVAMIRPPTWAGAAAAPMRGVKCSACAGSKWWQAAHYPTGWSCSTCYPVYDGQNVRFVES